MPTIEDRFLLRGGLKAAMVSLNEVPLRRELIVELDNLWTTGELDAKIGDGTTHYVDLPYLQVGAPTSAAPVMNEQTGTSYTLILTDAINPVRCTSTAAVSLTIPLHATVALPLYTPIPVFQGGAGIVTVSGVSGITVVAPNGAATTGVGDFRTLYQRATDVWVIG